MRKFVSEPTSAVNEDAVSCEFAIDEDVSILAFLRAEITETRSVTATTRTMIPES